LEVGEAGGRRWALTREKRRSKKELRRTTRGMPQVCGLAGQTLFDSPGLGLIRSGGGWPWTDRGLNCLSLHCQPASIEVDRLEVVSADEHTEADPAGSGGSFAGSLPNLPNLSWEDFERASELARRDLLNGQITGKDEDYVSAAPGPDFGPED
jgi:hypothetical protein